MSATTKPKANMNSLIMNPEVSRKMVIQPAAQFCEAIIMDRSLKGLLMDKGSRGLVEKLHGILQKIEAVQSAMESLVEQQRLSADAAGCDCALLYLALNLKTGRDRVEAEKIKSMGLAEILLNHTRSAAALEWRSGKVFSQAYQMTHLTRIHPFSAGHEHNQMVLDYVKKVAPDYYPVLAGYDGIRLSLNAAFKTLRKMLVELHELHRETFYGESIEREADAMGKRIFKTLPDSEYVAHILNQLYGT